MKTKKVLFFTLLIAAMAAMPKSAMSQVTIGSSEEPQPFSVLELISNGQPGQGLRLPQLKDNERKKLTTQIDTIANSVVKALANGLTIYNTDANCVQYWNGDKWIDAGTCQPFIPYVEPPAPTGCSQPIPPVIFMAYNLGADPTLDTPKKQMQYLAEHPYDKLDATVYGGLFQWGRGYIEDQALPEDQKKGWKHAVDLSDLPNRWRYDYMSNFYLADGGFTGALDDNGQPSDPVATQFIENNTSPYDWLTVPAKNDSLWGNGWPINHNFGIAAVADGALQGQGSYAGQYFQPTKWVMPQNNPCPSGFRVPTQDEWERIGAYDCKHHVVDNSISFSTSTSGTQPDNNSNLTWVPVVCGATFGNCKADAAWSNSTRSGYAVYATADWTAMSSSDRADLTGSAAKEPLLFLPAAGYRNYSGTLTNVGQDGDYISSSVTTAATRASHSMILYKAEVHPGRYGSFRACGLSVRCVKD
ncbi:MAG: fibrobacter succinogenes major paralogous domain-containing protein [Prevotellaceae bacterium]|jgi:hypothetical protein|nr:fibrobacter succinogenes major paralogous domain-containing protein [Prevotellaceae bacterium]